MDLEKQPYVRLNFDSTFQGRKINVDQLVIAIRNQITNESFLSGCRLPPVRVLAHQLGLSKNTIQVAYDELKSQGLVESKDRAGLFITTGKEANGVEPLEEVPAPHIKNIPLIKYNNPKQKGMTQLSSVFVDPRILPKEKLTACFRSVLKSPGIPEFHERQGMLALREKIAGRLQDRGMNVDPNHIIITVGSQQALDLVTRVLSTKIIATENPAYHSGKCLFEINGIQTVGLEINPFTGMNVSAWEASLATHKPGLVYLTTNFQNPNGYSYSSREISQIVHWAKEYDFGILEDDWGSEILSYSEFKPGLRALGGDQVLYMNSFTKKLLPSLRIGYLVANDATIETLLMAKQLSTSGVPGLIEAALFEFLDRGYYDTHLKYIQEQLDIRYKSCIDLLRELMPEEIHWTSPGGGPVLWLEVPQKVNLKNLAETLKSQGILIQLSHNTFFGKPHSHGFKIGYAFLNQEEMEECLSITSKEIKKQLNV